MNDYIRQWVLKKIYCGELVITANTVVFFCTDATREAAEAAFESLERDGHGTLLRNPLRFASTGVRIVSDP